MSSREKYLAGFLVFALVCGVAYGGYAFLVSPYLEKKRLIRDLQNDIADRESTKQTMEFKNKRLQTVMYKRSLPADLEVAKQEYSTALRRILRESKVPIGYSFAERPPDLRNIPQMAKGKPFYNKIAYTITISKIDVGTFMTFLKKFYDMNLLHQITQFTLKREDTASLAADKRTANKRADLSCTLAIEAVILDGVPQRKTLFAAPTGTGGLLGGMGLYSIENNAEVARGITPQEFVRVLAVPNRMYADVVAHDVFHGYLPPPEPPPPPKVVVEPPPPPKLPDLSAFVKFNSLISTSDGHMRVGIYDVYTDSYYDVDVVTLGEKVVVKGLKYTIKSEGRVIDKDHPAENWLNVQNPASSGNRKFWVYGLDGKSLILGDRDSSTPVAEAPKGKGNVFAKGNKGAPALPPADPKAAILGGLVVVGPKVERFYRWEFTQTMKQIKEIPKAEADAIIRKIQGLPATPQMEPAEKVNPFEAKPKPMPEKPAEKQPDEKDPEKEVAPMPKLAAK
jgi:hypothetical protein